MGNEESRQSILERFIGDHPGLYEGIKARHRTKIGKSALPHKVWTECVRCPYYPERCIEYAMVKDLPGQGPTPPPIQIRDRKHRQEGFTAGTIVPSEPFVPGATLPKKRAKK